MTGTAWILCGGLVALGVFQVVPVVVLYLRMRGRHTTDPDGNAPKAAILLALRGADPGLAVGVKRLMRQDYPNYELRIVVDSETDPAWDLVQEAIHATGAAHVQVSTLRERPSDCSLHCASLLQLAGDLDESVELFALADGDVVAHPGWLRELLAPIVQGKSDATTGHRWFVPARGRFGSMVRRAWNAGGVVSLCFFGIPWGGTFAGRTRDLRRSGLIEKWKKSLAVDAPIHECWRRLGLRVDFVPSLMMINREECTLSSGFGFASRQLLWTRLYQSRLFWTVVVIHAFVAPLAMAAALIASFYGIATGSSRGAAVILGSLAVCLGTMVVSLLLLDARVRSVAASREESTRSPSSGTWLRLALAVPVAQMIHLLAVARVLVQRRLHWRGVVYDIGSPFDVRKIEDRPLRQSDHPADPAQSL